MKMQWRDWYPTLVRTERTPGETADLIERFLSGTSRYPQEFNDFYECGVRDPELDAYRKRCDMLSGALEPGRTEKERLANLDVQESAIEELTAMVKQLRKLEVERQAALDADRT